MESKCYWNGSEIGNHIIEQLWRGPPEGCRGGRRLLEESSPRELVYYMFQ